MDECTEKPTTFADIILGSAPYASIIPTILFTLYYFDIILFRTLKLWLVISFLIFVLGPLIYKYSYSLQRNAIFLNFINIPANPNYSNPSQYGLDDVLNFYLTTQDGVRLGIWLILQQDYTINRSSINDEIDYITNVLRNGQDIIIYNHGNSGNRAASHRIELYKVLRRKFHVIAFDYRSYGDSSNVEPSEMGLVSDSKFIYKWVKSRTMSLSTLPNIFMWGHSLGTAISTHALALLASEGVHPAGLILESPFTNMKEEISEHPMSKLFRHLPWFKYTIVEPMQENNFTFASDKHIRKVDCPVLILHARDDAVVPYYLGKKLYESALKNRQEHQGIVQFKGFDRERKYGHKFICRAPELENILREFVAHCIEAKRNKTT